MWRQGSQRDPFHTDARTRLRAETECEGEGVAHAGAVDAVMECVGLGDADLEIMPQRQVLAANALN